MIKNYITKSLIALPLLAVVGLANAATLDYRHEYVAKDGQNADRLRVSHKFGNNVGFALEGKWTSKKVDDESRPFDNLVSKGHEVEINYTYKVNDVFTLNPAAVIDSNSESTAYKFQLRGAYKASDRLSLSARYRYGVTDYDRNKGSDSKHIHQGNFVIAYKFDSFDVSYDLEIKRTDYPAWKGKERDYAHNAKIQVPINKEWVPYAELGYVPYKAKGDKYKEDWQVRYRIGIKYNF